MTVSTIKAQSSSYLQKIINSDFDMGSINADGLKVDNLANNENDKGVPKTENPTSVLKIANDKGVPIMKNGKSTSGMKTVSSVKSMVKDKSVPNGILLSDATENETIASVSSEEIFRDVKSIDSDDSTPTIVPKSPSSGRPYHIKTNGSLNSSSCPSDAEQDKPDMTRPYNDDMQGPNKQMKKNTLPKQNNIPKLQRRHSEMEGINKESYMIGNQFKVLSGTASLERNIHLQHNNESSPAGDEKRLSGWHTIGHSFQRKLGGDFDRTKRTTWGGRYAHKQRESLKVLNELDNAYHYSSDSSVDHYYEANDRQRPKPLKAESANNGVELGIEDGGLDDVFINQTETEEDAKMYEENLQEYMSICMSGIYGIFVAVIGLVIPLADTFADPSLPFVFEAFYLYLYVMGILFIIYVYVFMMRKRQLRVTDIAKALSRRLSSSKSLTTSVSEQTKDGKLSTRQSINYPHSTGSFYLRLGALLFGVGSMVDSGLHFGQHVQAFDGQSMCNTPIEAAKPFGHLVFTFVQLYFIFLNSKLCIHNNRTIARFGMIHLCCTNICVWIQSLVMETMSVLHHWNVVHQVKVAMTTNTSDASPTQINSLDRTSSESPNLTVHESTPEVTCYWDDMMARVVQSTGPYLYSCTIEYSIICTGILFVMWTNVGTNQTPKHEERGTGNDFNTQNDDDISSLDMKRHRISVDCTNSSRGLFIGILVSVGAIITMVAFYVMINLKTFMETAVVLMLLSEMTMYILTSIASFLAAERMHKLRHYSALKFGLEESLLLVSFTGLVMFGVFNIVPDVHYTDKAHGVLNVMTNVLMILQASIQTVLLLTTRKFRALNKEQEKGKYGRQFITFLILCNFAMWTLETFQAREPEHNPIQVEMYGIKAWALFSHIAVPLGIFYRFHSFVYLLSIWKSAWKIKTDKEQH